MGEQTKEMTMIELYNEKLKLQKECQIYIDRCREKECSINELQSHIDSLRIELDEAQRNKLELPEEPIKVADALISATYKRTNCMTGKEYNKALYEPWELRQIAEHLLVYCNHAEVE